MYTSSMVDDDRVFEIDGKQCAVDAESPDQLHCVDPDTGDEEQINIDDVDEDLLD